MAHRQLQRGYHAMRRVIPHQRWQAAKKRLHPAQRELIKRLAAPSVPKLGRISVVVPCYNVEEYLSNCLDSIISQSYPHLEIIVVIDGSPDRSAAIARQFARWDRRVKVVEKPNGGLGSARNTGIARATGDFIAFVDSDDTIPAGAYAEMVQTLAQTGSDFVVGNLKRREGARLWVPKWAQEVHRENRLHITLDDFPEILADVFSWNKLFRRSFFDSVVRRFPEGIRYEDQEPTARAYAAARAFDVIAFPVYTWYIRGDGTSITQQKTEIRDLKDRLDVMRSVSDVLTQQASQQVVEHWQAKSVGLDLRSYYFEVPRTGDDFWALLRDGVRYIARSMDATSWANVDLHDRVLARLVERDQRHDVCTVLQVRAEVGDGVAVDPAPPASTATPPYLPDLRSTLDPADLVLSPAEDRLTAALIGYRTSGDVIEITGTAFVNGVDLDAHPSTLTVRLVPDSSGEHGHAVYPLAVRRVRIASIDDVVDNAMVSHASAGFVAQLSAADFVGHSRQTGPDLSWHVELALEIAGRCYSTQFRQWDRRGTANRLEHGALMDGFRLVPHFSDDRGLELSVRPAPVVAEQANLHGRQLRLRLGAGPLEPVREVQAVCQALGLSVGARTEPDAGGSRATLTLPALPPGALPRKEYVWQITAVTPDGSAPVDLAGGLCDLPESDARAGGLRIADAPTGGMQLLDQRTYAAVREISMDAWPDAFTVRGCATLPPGQAFLMALASDTDLWEPTHAEHDPVSGEFEVRFDVTAQRWGRDALAYATLGRSLRLLRDSGSTRDSLWVGVVPTSVGSVTSGYLRWHSGKACDVRFTLTPRAGALWVNVRPHMEQAEEGRQAQFRLQQSVPSLLTHPLRESVLFQCFGGRHASDSPLALYQELQRRGYDGTMAWAVADNSYAVPAGAPAVLVGSAAYYEALHTSRWLVNNNNFPHYFRKRGDQRYIQTWHGTPLKRIGRDVPSASLSLSYRALMEREVRAWDVMLAQNPFAAEALPRAFGYEGEVLDVGYPRNDVLAQGADSDYLQWIRTAIGVRPGSRVVLYAPTWRDNRRTENRQYALVNHLDLGQISTALGDTWTILVRGHSNTPGLAAYNAFDNVVDVSDYPDIAELMLAADVLVTDYSSVMFDFVVTGKPMLFLVPDLEEYADRTRGFYLDLREIAPGPLLDSTDGVIAALTQPSSTMAQRAGRYATFRDRFAPQDDGSAAERVVRAVWDAGP